MQATRKVAGLTRLALVCTIIFIGAVVVQAGTYPGSKSMSVDSGVFAYCGQRILAGDLLYRDCWDNKPPAVYYLNSLAILVGGSSPGSIWLFQAVWTAVTGVVFFLVMRDIWSAITAIPVTFLFLLTVLYPGYYQGGNYTETYVLLPIILVIWSLYRYLSYGSAPSSGSAPSIGRRGYLGLIGVLTATAFLLKPTYIAMGLAAGLTVLILDGRRKNLRRMAIHATFLLATAILPLLLVSAYWLAQGAFGDLWFAVFTHNFQYTQEGFSLGGLYGTLRMLLVLQPMATVVILALVSICAFLFQNWRSLAPALSKNQDFVSPTLASAERGEGEARLWLVLALALAIPMEMALIAMPGKNFGHYYLVPLPALAAISAYLFSRIEVSWRSQTRTTVWMAVTCAAILFLGAAWGVEILGKELPRKDYLVDSWDYVTHPVYHFTELEEYILAHSQDSQSILVWSSDPYLNFITGRRSPTRYIFPLHLLTPTNTGSSGFDELLEGLRLDPPALILSQVNPAAGLPSFEAQEEDLCSACTPEARQGMLDLKHYIERNYRMDRQIWDWHIYQRNP